jgi:hypothetical protein
MALRQASAMVPGLRFQLRSNLIAIAVLAACIGSFQVGAIEGEIIDGDRAKLTKNSGAERLAIATGVPADEKAKLIGTAVAIRHSRVLLMSDNVRGTGFILSRRCRLVITAGRVADYFFRTGSLCAVLEGSSQVRRIVKVWFHPRIKREIDFGLHAPTFDPDDGPISSYSPDLAVVQLSNDSEELSEGSSSMG